MIERRVSVGGTADQSPITRPYAKHFLRVYSHNATICEFAGENGWKTSRDFTHRRPTRRPLQPEALHNNTTSRNGNLQDPKRIHYHRS